MTRRWAGALAAWLLGAMVFFRSTVFSGFDHLTGDIGDARLVALLHEHWLDVLRGHQSWRSPNFFHPIRGALGYSDTFLLDEVLYAPLRWLGLDRYTALQTTLILLTLVGFIGATRVLHRLIGLAWWPAVGLAVVMTFANGMAVQASHAQLFALHWLPWAILLMQRALTATARRAQALWSLAAGGFVGLLMFSTYYIAWFAILGAAVFGLFMAMQRSAVISQRTLREHARLVWVRVVAFAGGFAVPMVPFLMTYLPTLDESGGRSFDDVMQLAPVWTDAVNVSGTNLVWGRLLRAWWSDPAALSSVETNDAATPLLLLGVAVCIVLAWRRLRGDTTLRAAVARALLGVTLVFIVLPLRFGSFSCWRSVWLFVPGARALRAIGRVEMLAAYTAPLAVAATVVALASQRPPRTRAPRTRRTTALVAALLVLLAVEQVNTRDLARLDHSTETAFIAGITSPPPTCRSFSVRGVPGRPDYAIQVDAMIVAQTTGLPTVNGYSGSSPPYWSLHPGNDNYFDQLRIWIELQRLHNVCTYDTLTGRWKVDPDAATN